MVRLWDKFEEQAGGLLLLLSVLLVFGQILARTVFGFGISGLYELATYCAIYSVFLTASLAIKNNLHIRIDLLANVLPGPQAFWLEVIALLIMAIVSAALCWSGVLLVQESHMLGDRTLGTISLAVWAVQLILPLAGALMLMRTAQRFWLVVRQGRRVFRSEVAELDFL